MKMRVRWLFQLSPLHVIALLTLLGSFVPARAVDYLVDARAEPTRLTFAAESPDNNRVLIWVKVREAGGQPAPDMTPIRFTTSLGIITPLIYTRNGEATATLENTDGPGRARVDIQPEGNRATTLYIEYLGPGGTPAMRVTPPRLHYRVQAKQCYYSADKLIFDLRDSAEFSMPELTVTASSIQFDIRQRVVTAQFGVTVKKGTQSFTATRIRLELGQGIGLAEVSDPAPARLLVQLSDLTLSEDARTQQMNCDPLDPQPTRTWVIGPEATIYPNEQQIQFRRPKFYLNGVDLPVLWMPYHVLRYNESRTNTFFNSQVTVTSDPGLNVDFPIYYAASPSHVGSVHIRNLTKNTSPTGIAGLQFGIEEEYRIGDAADGALYLDDLTRATRSLYWEHSHDLGQTRINGSVTYDRYTATDAYTTRARTSIYRPFGQVSVSLSGNWSDYKNEQSYDTLLSLSPPTLKVGGDGFGLNFSPYVGWRSSSSSQGGFSEGLNSSLGFPSITFLGGRVYPNVNHGIARYADGTVINSFDAGLRYQRNLFGAFQGSFGYSFSKQHSSSETAVAQKPSQRLDLNISGGGKTWNTYLYGSYSLNNETLFSSLNFTYYLPWDLSKERERRWFIEYGARYALMSNSLINQSAEHHFSLGRPIGSYTALLHYSPTGNTGQTGIGMFTGKKWALELVRSGW